MPRRYPPSVSPESPRFVEVRPHGCRDRLRSRCHRADDLQLAQSGAQRYRTEAWLSSIESGRTRRCPSSHRRAGPHASRNCRSRWRPQRRFEAIEVMATDGLPVQVACRILEVSESGFYEWRNHPPSDRPLRHAWLTQRTTEVHAASHGTYGARRVHGRTYPWSRYCSGTRLRRVVDETCWCERTSGKQTCTFKASDPNRKRSRRLSVHSRAHYSLRQLR